MYLLLRKHEAATYQDKAAQGSDSQLLAVAAQAGEVGSEQADACILRWPRCKTGTSVCRFCFPPMARYPVFMNAFRTDPTERAEACAHTLQGSPTGHQLSKGVLKGVSKHP